jgi:hypothetical protein
VHYYAYYEKERTHVGTLLDEQRLRRSITQFYLLRKAANDVGLNLRITETNSANDGGRRGISDVFGAALWTADATFEFARAGATGVHMCVCFFFAFFPAWWTGGKSRAVRAKRHNTPLPL